MGSSLLIQARSTRAETGLADGVRARPMRPGIRRMVRRTGPGVKRRIWAMSRSNAARSMSSSSSFSSSRSRRHAVEEQVDREDDDDEVVEAADDRDVVGDDVASDDEVPGRGAEQDLAIGRHPLVEDERAHDSRA